MRAGTRPLTWLLAIVCLAALGGCRRVTIISFYADTPAPKTDSLVINLHGFAMKRSVQLGGMDEQLGLYDLRGDLIDISAYGCAVASDGSSYITSINMMNGQPPPISYSIASDAILIHMMRFSGDPHTPCPRVEHDGGVSGEPSDTGGAAGMGSGGSNAGGAAGAGSGGMSGSGGTDGGVDAAGGADAGAGSGGNTGVGGCDDAGHTEVDAGACQAPDPGTAQPPSNVPTTDPCVTYCARIIGPRDGGPALCPTSNTYPDVATCERYCTLAALPAGATNNDSGNTLACRAFNLAMAEMGSGTARTNACLAAGPIGAGPGPGGTGGCGSGTCATFCDAWAAICSPGATSDCMAACTSATDAVCRFDWLMRAATVDTRYCDLVAFTSTCIVPTCPGP